MSKKHNERSHLTQQQQSQRLGYEAINSIPWEHQPPSPPSPLTSLPPPHADSSPNRDRTRTQTSVTSFGGVSLLGSDANPGDAQELLDNLDRATNLLRKHLLDLEAAESGGHV